MADVSPLVGRTYSQEPHTQSSGPLTSVLAFDFDTEEQQCQAITEKRDVISPKFTKTGAQKQVPP